MYNGLQMKLFRSENRESFAEIKPNLVSKDADCTHTSSVHFTGSGIDYMTQKIMILLHERVLLKCQ
jgi:hypothetical protein